MADELNKVEEIKPVKVEVVKDDGDADFTGVDNPNTIWDNALFLPNGSIRSLIALGVIGGFMIYVFGHPTVPPELKDITLLVLGFYFGNRTK
jgi:hypothetical protein